MPSDIPPHIHGKDLPKGIKKSTISVTCDHLEKMLHVANNGEFSFFSDEPEKMGGENEFPAPLTYIASGIGFWLLTNLKRYASMKKISIKSARVKVELDFFLSGSIVDENIESGVSEVRSFFEVSSEENFANIFSVIKLAKKGCFAESLVINSVPLKSICIINGNKIDNI